jgi:FkbM family methyltransferase
MRRPLDVASPDGFRMRAWPDSTMASMMIYCRGRPDWEEAAFLRHFLRPGDGFVDVGAHIGTYSLLAAPLVGPDGWVAAYEPSPESAARFRANLAMNAFPWVLLTEAAVGDSDGSVRFTTGLMTINQIALPGMTRSIAVRQLRLDEALSGREAAAAKLDIEGAEPLALAGWEQSLRRGRPLAMLIEINDGIRRFGFEEAAFLRWLADRGYRAGLYDSERRRIQWCAEPWRLRENILAVHEPSLPEVLRRIQERRVPA